MKTNIFGVCNFCKTNPRLSYGYRCRECLREYAQIYRKENCKYQNEHRRKAYAVRRQKMTPQQKKKFNENVRKYIKLRIEKMTHQQKEEYKDRRKNKYYPKRNKIAEKNYQRNYHWKLRLDIISAYGGKCKCCGETTPEFLSLEHSKGDGQIHA